MNFPYVLSDENLLRSKNEKMEKNYVLSECPSLYIYIMILGHISLILNMFVVFDCQRVNTCLTWSTFGACLGSMFVNVWHRCTSWSTQSLFQNGNAPPVTLPNTFPTEQTETGVRFASGTANNLSPIEARTWYLPYASVCSEAAIGLQS